MVESSMANKIDKILFDEEHTSVNEMNRRVFQAAREQLFSVSPDIAYDQNTADSFKDLYQCTKDLIV